MSSDFSGSYKVVVVEPLDERSCLCAVQDRAMARAEQRPVVCTAPWPAEGWFATREPHTPRRDMNPLLRLGHRPRDFASEKLTGLHCDSVSPNSMLENKIWIKCWRLVCEQRSPRIGSLGPRTLTSKCDGDMSSCSEFSSRASEFGWLLAGFLLTSSLAGSRVRSPVECMPNTGKPAEEKRKRKRSKTPARGGGPPSE